MEKPLQTKSVNALFAFFKTTLLTLEQMTTGFFSSKTITRLLVIPIKDGNLNLSSSTKRPLNGYISMVLLLLSLIFMGNAFGQTITTATGGSAISADTSGSGTFTSLTGPIYSEASSGNVGTGPIILNVPPGFIFDTGGTAPTVRINRIAGGGADNRNINDAASGTSIAITSRTTTQITFTVSAASSNGVTCSLTWQNIRVRPTAGSPLASGNITKTGTSSMSGVTNSSTNFGTLTEVAGNATKLAFTTQPSSGIYGSSLNPVVILQDQYNNPTTTTTGNLATLNVTIAIASGTGSVSGITSLNIGSAGGNGTVTFSNLETTTIGAKTITASATGLTSVTSSSFTVTAAPLTITADNVNKTYGTTISSPGAGQTTFTLSGIQNSETVGSVTITYGTGTAATAAVGTYATVTPSLAVGGTFTAANYTITYTSGNMIVGAKTLTIGTPTIASKAYDATTIAGVVTVGALSGFIGTETVTATATAANYSSANVGSYPGTVITYTLANGLNGGLASNYSLANGSATGAITAKVLTIGTPTIASKAYDATTTAGAVTVGALSGFIGTQTVTATATAANYSSANVGSYPGIVVTYILANGANGGLASNYSLANGSATAAITPKVLTIGTPTIASKIYDATSSAGAVTVGALSGFIGTQTVTATATAANYSSANVGSYLGTVITYTLANGTNGGLATNYSLANGSATGVITAKALTIGVPIIASKAYDGTTTAGAVTEGVLSGFIGTQTVIATGTAANYSSANVGSYPGVVVTYTLANGLNGGLATNYSLANGSATGVITAGPFVRMQLLLPGETAAPGTGSGKTGTPTAQNTTTPFTVTANAVDAFWNVVTTAPGNTIAITTSDGTTILPTNANLASGTRTFSITLRTPGSATVTATNVTNGGITPNTSASVTVTAGTKTSIADGNWSASGTWSPAGEPYLFDLVRINTNHDITVTANATCAAINFIGTASILSVNTGVTLNVTGAVTLDSYDDNRFTDAIIGGVGTLNAGSLNMGLASTLDSTANSENTLVLNIPVMNVAGDFTIFNNDEGGGDANEPRFFINPPCVLSASKVVMIQTGNGGGGSRIITFDMDNGSTLNLSGGPNPITISSEIALDFDHVNFALGSSSIINYNGSVAQNIPASIFNSRSGGSTSSAVPVNYGNLSINNTSVSGATAAAGLTVNGSLAIGSTGKFVAGNFTHSLAGNWTNNGAFTANNSMIDFDGGGAQAINGTTATTFHDVHITKTGTNTLTIDTNTTVGDDLTFSGSGGILSINSPRVVTVTDQIFVVSNASSAVTTSITGAGTLNVSNAVTVGVDPNPSTNSSIATTLNSSVAIFNITNNLNINSYFSNGNRRNNGVFNLISGTLTISGEINTTNENSGNVSTFSMATGTQSGLLKLAGGAPFNLSPTGTNTINLNGSAAVVEYLGSVPQTALGTTYRTLKINNSNTGVTLSGNATATTLDLTDGLVTTGTNTMILASGGSITNASGASYVNGKLNRTFTSTTPATFPLGKGGIYRPVVFTYATTPSTRNVTIEQFETGTPFTSSASLATFGSRYWNVTQSATGVAYRVGLNDGGNTAPSGSSVVILRRDNGIITPNATSYSAPNYSNVTAFAATVVSNDVSLGVNNIPLTITGISGINNKVYNGNAIATPIGTPTLTGTIVSGDTVTLTGTPVYTFNNKNVGAGKAVTVTGFTLSGTGASGYALPTPNQIPGLTADITARPIQISANTNTKTFDNFTTSATLPSLTSGALQGTDTFGFIQTYDNKNAGTNKTLTPSGIVNDGNSGNNYDVTLVADNTGVINAKILTIATPTTIGKVYDGTNVAATTAGSWALTGVISPNDVTLNKSAVFASKDFGTWAITSTSTLSGADAGNYLLIQPTLTSRTISKIALTITGTTTVDKEYDRTNTAVLTDGVLDGVVSGEDVTLVLSGRYATANAGGPYVMTSTSTIIGNDIANYTLTQPTTLTPRSISKVTLTVSGATTVDKAYNGNTIASVSGGSLIGVVPGDGVSLTQSGIFPSKDVGGPYAITPNFSIGGASIANYILTQPVLNDASITPKQLTISGTSQNKVYDETSVATLINPILNGVVAGESVLLDLIVNYYSSPGVTVKDAGGPYLVVSTSTISAGDIGTDIANYSLTQPTLSSRNINKIPLTITGTTTEDKEYDRTNTAILKDGVLNGVLLGDDVTLVLSGRYASANAGGPYAMTSTSTIVGADIGNYSLTQPTTLTPRSISKVTLTIGGTPTTSDKAYDGNTNAAVTGGSLIGVVSGDNITLIQAGIYSNKNVGGPYSVTPNFSIAGGAAINYDLIQVPLADASITPKVLTISGISQNKVYDGTSTATLTGVGAGSLVGVVAGETINLNLIVDYYSSPGVTVKNAADAFVVYEVISTSTIASGDINTDLANYTFIQPNLTPRKITKIPLTVTGVTASNKVYDGNTTATIDVSLAVLNGTILPGEIVTLNTTLAEATFDTADVGVGKTVTGVKFNLNGADSDNYTVVDPIMTASITLRAITITANVISKCAESTYIFTGAEFTSDYTVPGDITSVTLTSAGSGVLAGVGSYPVVASNAAGAGIANYTFNYLPGTLVVNGLPNATMTNDSVNCINQVSNITFTGSNGTGGTNVQYKFYYTIDGTLFTVSTLPGNNSVTVNVPSNTVRSLEYVLTAVEDVNTSCSKVISGASITVNITLCTQLRFLQCGSPMRFITDAVQASPVTGATQYRFNIVRTDNPSDNRTVTVNRYYFTYGELPGRLQYGKSYNVRVSLFTGSWGSPGPVCTLIAPPEPAIIFTKVRDFQCGQILRYMTSRVEAIPVYSATRYEFEVTSAAGTFVKPSASYHFSLTGSIPGGALPNTAYTIRVRSFNGNTMLRDWGDPCVIRTPSARISETNVSDSIFNVKAFPNPFASHFSLDIESSSDDQVELKVYDMIGRQLEVRKATVSELSVLDVGRNYPSGVYNVLVSQGDKVRSLRMVKR